MPKKKNASRDSAVAMIIVALLVGVMVGFASGWELSAMQYRSPASPVGAAGVSANGGPIALPEVKDEGFLRASPIAYRGVVESTGSAGLRVTVMEGIGGKPLVTLLVGKNADLVALRPAKVVTMDLSGADLSRGLPPPPKPPADPYKEEPMKLSAFMKGDVIEFSTVEPVADGASFKVDKITWIMNLSAQAQQGGAVGDGTPAPPMPKTP